MAVQGGESFKTKKFKEMYEAKLEFPETGGVGGGGGKIPFWNYTLHPMDVLFKKHI